MLTYQQVAKQLGVHPKTVAEWAEKRMLTVIRLGHRTVRIREADLDKFVSRKTRNAK